MKAKLSIRNKRRNVSCSYLFLSFLRIIRSYYFAHWYTKDTVVFKPRRFRISNLVNFEVFL